MRQKCEYPAQIRCDELKQEMLVPDVQTKHRKRLVSRVPTLLMLTQYPDAEILLQEIQISIICHCYLLQGQSNTCYL